MPSLRKAICVSDKCRENNNRLRYKYHFLKASHESTQKFISKWWKSNCENYDNFQRQPYLRSLPPPQRTLSTADTAYIVRVITKMKFWSCSRGVCDTSTWFKFNIVNIGKDLGRYQRENRCVCVCVGREKCRIRLIKFVCLSPLAKLHARVKQIVNLSLASLHAQSLEFWDGREGKKTKSGHAGCGWCKMTVYRCQPSGEIIVKQRTFIASGWTSKLITVQNDFPILFALWRGMVVVVVGSAPLNIYI